MTILGKEVESENPIEINQDARSRGIYVIGSTGTGKTTLLQSIAYQDMKAGKGLCVLDPHGDMIDWLMLRVPENRLKDVIYFNPSDLYYPLGINLLECNRNDPTQVRWVISNFISGLSRMYAHSWGPRLEHVLSHTLWTAMKIEGSTILEVLLLLTNEKYRKEHTSELDETLLVNFWNEFPESVKQRFELIGSTVNKLTPFLLDHQMRNIVGQSKSSFNMRRIMDEQKILLVNLSKGELGENNSALLGSFIINMILIAALSRRDMPYEQRQNRPFHVIVDEYQTFASDSFSVLQSEARKYAVDLVVAHQFRDQLTEEVKGSALNVGNFISFRTTGIDGRELATQFDNTPPEPDPVWETVRVESSQWKDIFAKSPHDKLVPGTPRMYSDVTIETANDLANLIPFRAKTKVLEHHEKLERLVLVENEINTIHPDKEKDELAEDCYGSPDRKNIKIITENTRKEYANSKAMVDEEITKRTGGAADESIDNDLAIPAAEKRN